MHDLRHPWSANTNMINGFYEEPSRVEAEHRYLDHRRRRREREMENLASGINFQYTSPYMTDGHSLVRETADQLQL